MATVEQILDSTLPAPSIVWNPTRATPINSRIDFTRTTAAWGLTASQKYEKFTDGEPAVYGDENGFYKNSAGYNKFLSPKDQRNPDNIKGGTLQNDVGSKVGIVGSRFEESTNTEKHSFIPDFTTLATDEKGAVSAVVEPGSRNAFLLRISGNSTSGPRAAFHMPDSGEPSVFNEQPGDATIVDARLEEVIPGVYLIGLSAIPASGDYFQHPKLGPTPVPGDSGAGTEYYNGDGKDVIFYQTQFEGGYMGSRVLEGGVQVNGSEAEITDLSGHNADEGTYFIEIESRANFQEHRAAHKDRVNILIYGGSGAVLRHDPSSGKWVAKGDGTFLKSGSTERFKTTKVALSYNRGEVSIHVDGSSGGSVTENSSGDVFTKTPGKLALKGSNVVYKNFRYYPQELTDLQKKTLTKI